MANCTADAKPRIDVAIPCYQYGRFLRECVESVLSQDVDGIRVLVIDNASTDDSVEVAQQLALEDKRVELIVNRTNIGPTANYNKGIEWATAEYFTLLDADDMLAPGCLQRALPVLDANPEVGFAYGFEALQLPDGSVRRPAGETDRAPWQIITGWRFIQDACRMPRNFVGAPTVVRRTAVQKRAGAYRAELPYSDDLEMWLRLAAYGGVASTGRVQGIRRVHAQQHSTAFRSAMARDFREREKAFVSFFAHEGHALPEAKPLLAKARRGLGAHAYWSAISHLCRGHLHDAGELLAFCLRRRPTTALLPPFGWLLRMDRPMHRIVDVAREMLRRLRTPLRNAATPTHDPYQ
ncbi:MAG TPA: glycosyltransferase family 2 protein [Hyphomicrobiaceae bacterium]|nr:glycosyltransferase family 2 protein [Hyphomicrobiaceae bacterium]